jgi:opacity protein-like surface antigen
LDEAARTLNLSASALLWGLFIYIVAVAIEKTLMVYAGLGIGQVSAKRKTALSILAIVGLHVAEQVLSALLMFLFTPSQNGFTIFQGADGAAIIRYIFWWYIGSAVVFGSIYAFACNWMLKRHLNLA